MKLDYYHPSENCSRICIQCEHVQAEGENIAIVDRHISSGYASLVFNSSGYALIHEKPVVKLPSSFLVVPLFRSVKIGIYEDLDSFIVTCSASVLSRLLSINLASAKSCYYRQIYNNWFKKLEKEIRMHRTGSDRMDIVEDFFMKFGLDDYQYDDIDNLYNEIITSQGRTPITELIDKFDKSPRYFRHHFIQRVGINAKTLARVVRVNYLWSSIMRNNAVDFQDMVFEGDFFDQAHFIHDFKKLVGETPNYFFNRNLENVKIISGKIK